MTVKEVDIGGPNKEVIKHIKRLLKQAKAGEIRGIAYATAKSAGTTSSGWTGIERAASFLGELCILRARIENQILQEYHQDELER